MGLDDRMRAAMRNEGDGGRGDTGAVRRRARTRVLRRRAAFGTAAILVVTAVGVTALATRDDGGRSANPPVATAPGVARLPANAQLAMSKVPRATPDATDVPKLVAANSQFAFDLYHQLAKANTNLFFSPSSISTALAMVDAGARGNTAAEMAHTLHFGELPGDQLHAAFNALAQELLATRTSHDKGRTPLAIELSNSAWGQRGFPFLQAYLDTLAKYYGAGLRLSDFEHNAEAERVRINTYVAQQTQGRIKELLPQGIVDQLTRLVLVNTITFTADWRTPFPKASTIAAPFTRLDGSTVSVPMMRLRDGAGIKFVLAGDYAAVSLPYSGGASMLVIVPKDGKFAAVQAGLSASLLRQIDTSLRSGDVVVRLPKFTFTSHAKLRRTLEALGMRDGFDAQRADLSGIDGRNDLYLAEVVHQATIRVDEDGTTAAAATGAVVEVESAPPAVSADRPFLYLIRDDATGAILFAGQVLDPTVTSVS